MSEPTGLPPRPSPPPTALNAPNRRAPADRRANGGTERRDRTSERRSIARDAARTADSGAAQTPEQPWLKRHATRIRWVTWAAIALIVMRLVVPRPDGWRRWSDAQAALEDLAAARTGALLYYQSATREWPAPGRAGIVPAGMLPYLAGDVSYSRPRYHLSWEYAADTVSGARVVGISVIGDDPLLAQTMATRAPEGMPFIVSGRRFIALIASAAGR